MSDLANADLVEPKPVEEARSLTHVTADGAMWIMVSMVVTRFLSVASQLALTRLLLPDAFGLVGLTQFVLGITTFMGTLSLAQFLVARQRRIARYAAPAFWVTMALGVWGGVLLALAAPIAAWVYDDHRLIGLLLFSAVACPVHASSVVPTAVAQIRLRFQSLAIMGLAGMLAQVGSSILAAWAGMGAYSILIGLAVGAAVRVGGLMWVLRLRFPWRPRGRFKVERILIAQTSWWVVGVGILTNVIGQGDYATMGLFFDKTDVGYYFFAFNLSQQAVVLLGTSLGWVLFPAIARLAGDWDRQTAALMRAVRMLTLIGAPGGLLMVFLMPPIVHAFGPKYLPAIPIAQVMAAGAVGVLVVAPAAALVTAQERYRIYFFSTLLQAILFLFMVYLGCLSGHVLGVAIGASIYFWVGGPLGLLIALDGWRIRWQSVRSVVQAMGVPMFWSLPGLAVGWMVWSEVSTNGTLRSDLVRSLLAAAAFVVVSVPTLYLTMKPACRELIHIFRAVLSRLPGLNRLKPVAG